MDRSHSLTLELWKLIQHHREMVTFFIRVVFSFIEKILNEEFSRIYVCRFNRRAAVVRLKKFRERLKEEEYTNKRKHHYYIFRKGSFPRNERRARSLTIIVFLLRIFYQKYKFFRCNNLTPLMFLLQCSGA